MIKESDINYLHMKNLELMLELEKAKERILVARKIIVNSRPQQSSINPIPVTQLIGLRTKWLRENK